MREKERIKLPIIVEGRYDKSKISSIFDATVITTGGFAIFNSKEKRALIKKLAERGGIILLTDSDAGGAQIRSFLSGILPKDRIFHLYIPEVEGKERRKRAPSKAGLLGVEGMDAEILIKLLSPFASSSEEAASEKEKRSVTKLDFYNSGLSGGDLSAEKRRRLAARLGLPGNMSANALIEAINLIIGYSEYEKALAEISAE